MASFTCERAELDTRFMYLIRQPIVILARNRFLIRKLKTDAPDISPFIPVGCKCVPKFRRESLYFNSRGTPANCSLNLSAKSGYSEAASLTLVLKYIFRCSR